MAYSTKARLCVFRSLKHNYVQIIDANSHKVVFGLSDKKLPGKTKTQRANNLGTEIAKVAMKNKINEVVFDRRGYKYHGRIKAIAQAAREQGLKF